MSPIPEVFPFANLDESWRYPAWIRGLRRANGVYVFKERRTGEIVYVGESHSDRLYSTLTRHLQAWTDKYATAGATYTRDEVDVAVIVVPAEHATHLQNELICALIPRDNRLQCVQIFGLDADGHPIEEDDDADEIEYDERYDFEAYAYGDTEIDAAYVEDVVESRTTPPPDYDYDIPLLLEGIAYDFTQADTAQDDTGDIPF